MRQEEVEAVVEALREAALRPGQWPDALSIMARAVGSAGATAFTISVGGETALTSPSFADTAADYLANGWAERTTRGRVAPGRVGEHRRPAHLNGPSRRHSPSSGSTPAGLPSRDRRIFSTLSSAAFSSRSQCAFSASPRS